MLSFNTTIKIADLIRATVDSEIQSETIRQILCEKPTFEPFTAFKRISHLSSAITSQAIYDFLSENDIRIRKQDAYYLIRLYDNKGSGKLSYTEFLRAVLLRSDQELRREVNTRKTYNIADDEGLDHNIEHAIARIFEQELESFHKCEVIRQELALCEDFSIIEAFREIDIRDDGYIDSEKLRRFMVRVDDPLNQDEIDAFMCRVDRDNDGIIRYSDFLEVFYTSEVEYESEKANANTKASTNPEPVKDQAEISTPQKPSSKMTSGENFFSPYSTRASMTTSAMKASPKKFEETEKNEEVEDIDAEAATQPASVQSPYFALNHGEKRESSLKPEEEQELVKAFNEILEHISAVEDAKNSLALKKDFNVCNAFAVFDAEKKGVVTTKQFEKELQAFVSCNKSHIALLIKRLDADSDGLVKIQNFAHLLMPKAEQFARAVYSRPLYYISEVDTALGAFSQNTLEELKTLLGKLIEEEVLCESIRQRLSKRQAFNLNDAFATLDKSDNGFVTVEQFQDLLEENGVFAPKKDIMSLVERYEKAEKGKISYYDFVREMTPKLAEQC